MTATTPTPVLAVLTRVAAAATGAARGRLLIAADAAEHLVVVATHGAGESWTGVAAGGIARYVMATGQPQVLSQAPPAPGGVATVSALCVPCACDDETVGALELEDKSGGGAFSIDDLELASLLGGIAGVAIARRRPPRLADPDRLAGDLGRLAAVGSARYALIARLVRDLLDA